MADEATTQTIQATAAALRCQMFADDMRSPQTKGYPDPLTLIADRWEDAKAIEAGGRALLALAAATERAEKAERACESLLADCEAVRAVASKALGKSDAAGTEAELVAAALAKVERERAAAEARAKRLEAVCIEVDGLLEGVEGFGPSDDESLDAVHAALTAALSDPTPGAP